MVLAVHSTQAFPEWTWEVAYPVCFQYCVDSVAETAQPPKKRDVTPDHGPSIVAEVRGWCSPGIGLVLQGVHFLLPST